MAGVVSFGLAWQLQAGNITQLKLDQSNERSSIQRAARVTLERSMQTFAKADADAATRATRNRTDAAAAVNAGAGLRIASADIVRTASTDNTACVASVAIFNELLGTVVEAGGRMAIEADAWEVDAIKQRDSAMP